MILYCTSLWVACGFLGFFCFWGGGYTSLVFCVNLGHLTWVRLQEQCSLWELGWLYLATAAPRTVQFMGNLGCLTWVRLQQPQEQCYPFWAACAVFLCVQTMVCPPVFGIFVWTVDASNCTWGLYKHWKRIWTVSWLWGKKSLAALRNQTCRVLHLGFASGFWSSAVPAKLSWSVLYQLNCPAPLSLAFPSTQMFPLSWGHFYGHVDCHWL